MCGQNDGVIVCVRKCLLENWCLGRKAERGKEGASDFALGLRERVRVRAVRRRSRATVCDHEKIRTREAIEIQLDSFTHSARSQ